jgi:aminopeptidase N
VDRNALPGLGIRQRPGLCLRPLLLDERSLQYVTGHIETIADPFRRALVWGALWHGVRELRLAPSAYVRLAIRALPLESDEALTQCVLGPQSVLGHTAGAFQRYLSDSQRATLVPDSARSPVRRQRWRA